MWFDGENESFNGVLIRNNILVNSMSISIQNYKIIMQSGSPRRYPYFDVVEGLAWSHEPEIYAGSSVCHWYGLPCQRGQG